MEKLPVFTYMVW